MPTNWFIGIDWNRDGFFCKNTQHGNYGNLNLLPSPMSWDDLTTPVLYNTTVTRQQRVSNPGVRVARIQCATDNFSGFYIGAKGSGTSITAVDEIPVTPSTAYVVRVWVRGISNYAGLSLNFAVVDENAAVLATASPQITGAWHAYTLTFTTAANSDFIYIRFRKDVSAAQPIYEVAGVALFKGSTVPGDPLNLIPTPISLSRLTPSVVSGSAVSKVNEATDYGVKAFQAQTGTNTAGGIRIGYTGSVNEIPVRKSVQYTLAFWMKASSAINMKTVIDDQAGGNMSPQTFTYTAPTTWTRLTHTFTTGSTSDYLDIIIQKNSVATDVLVKIAGLMLIEGSVAPLAFNSGALSDLYDPVPVASANWFLGLRRPYQEVADDSMLQLTLNNQHRYLSPEGPLAGLITPFKLVMVQSDDGTTVRTHWLGWIESIEPDVNAKGKRQARITAAGPMQYLKAAETRLELQENQRTDQIAAALVKEVVVPPVLTNLWILGRPEHSELGRITFLLGATSYSQMDTGLTTLAIAADNWVQQGGMSNAEQDTFNVYRALADIAAAERGRFLFGRDGKALFWNRHRLLIEDDPAATFNDSMQNLTYTYAGLEDFKNDVVVMCHPRTITPNDDEVLWRLQDEIRIGAGESRKLYAKYQDDSGNRIGGKDITISDVTFRKDETDVPATVELQTFTTEQKTRSAAISLGDAKANVTYDIRANSAEVTIENIGTVTIFLTGLVLRGRKITDFGRMEASAIDQASITDFGRRTLKLNLPALDKLSEAQDIAKFEIARRRLPRGNILSIALVSHAIDGGEHHVSQLARIMGDLVNIQESQTGHEASYFIIGEMHELEESGTKLETTWYVEPAPTPWPWKLDDGVYSKLDKTTRLTY